MGFPALESRSGVDLSMTTAPAAMPRPLSHRACIAVMATASLLLYGLACLAVGLIWQTL